MRRQIKEYRAKDGEKLYFRYRNWRGDWHTYKVIVESVVYGEYDSGGHFSDGSMRWVMHGWVVSRDGEERPGRRTFLLDGIKFDLDATVLSGVTAPEDDPLVDERVCRAESPRDDLGRHA